MISKELLASSYTLHILEFMIRAPLCYVGAVRLLCSPQHNTPVKRWRPITFQINLYGNASISRNPHCSMGWDTRALRSSWATRWVKFPIIGFSCMTMIIISFQVDLRIRSQRISEFTSQKTHHPSSNQQRFLGYSRLHSHKVSGAWPRCTRFWKSTKVETPVWKITFRCLRFEGVGHRRKVTATSLLTTMFSPQSVFVKICVCLN